MVLLHYDVIKWKHFPRYWPFVRGIHRGQGKWRGALMFPLIYARINGWANTGEAGDLTRHHAHYDVIVMYILIPWLRLCRGVYNLVIFRTRYKRQKFSRCVICFYNHAALDYTLNYHSFLFVCFDDAICQMAKHLYVDIYVHLSYSLRSDFRNIPGLQYAPNHQTPLQLFEFLRCFIMMLMAREISLMRCEVVANLSANGSTAFQWKLCCHWMKGLRRHHISRQCPVAPFTNMVVL